MSALEVIRTAVMPTAACTPAVAADSEREGLTPRLISVNLRDGG